MKLELSNKVKTNIKAVILTALALLIVLFLIVMLVKHTAEFIAILVFVVLLGFAGYFIFVTFMVIRDVIVEHQEKKQVKERRRAKGY